MGRLVLFAIAVLVMFAVDPSAAEFGLQLGLAFFATGVAIKLLKKL